MMKRTHPEWDLHPEEPKEKESASPPPAPKQTYF